MAAFDINNFACVADCYQPSFVLDNAPLAIVVIGAWMMPHWRDLPFVAAVAVVAHIAGVLVRWPGLPIYALAHPDVLASWVMIPLYFVFALGLGGIVYAVKRLWPRARAEDSADAA